MRPDLIKALGRYGDPEIVAEAHRRFANSLAQPGSLPPNLREPVLTIVGQTADQATWNQLRRMGEAATSTEEKLRYFDAMADASDPKLIAQSVRYAGSGKIPGGREEEIIYEASDHSGNPEEVWKQTKLQQVSIRPLLAEEEQSSLLPAAAGGSMEAATASALLAEPASHADTGSKMLAAETVDAIRTSVELKQRTVAEFGNWLKGR